MAPKEVEPWARCLLPSANRSVVWLFDVDDTLTDTQSMHHRAADSLVAELATQMSESLAASVVNRFRGVFDELLTVHQQVPVSDKNRLLSLKQLDSRVRSYQREILEKWHITRPFSREVLLRIASEDCGALLTPDGLRHCTDRYWDHMRENPIVFPDAVRLSRKLAIQGAPIYLMTSSDARYRERRNGQFTYDPKESLEDKNRRMENLKNHGIRYAKAFIGDPIDKPSADFYNRALSEISHDLDSPLESLFTVVIGDSYRSDIQTPLELLDSTIGIWCRRGQPSIRVEEERVVSIGDFNMFIEALEAVESKDKR
ncbi:HAD family hydrolase [Streptomyces sp. NPDC052127]|uniref:HAD family hydrolase n=1 Tax=Streptomyces sp. NPDC052127 TaxID=3155679 RepID=UPI00343E4891